MLARRAPRHTDYLALVALVALACACYALSLHGPFIFDDEANIVENPAIRALWPPGWLQQGRPVTVLTFALDYAAFGLDVLGYHVTNVALHAGVVALAFVILCDALEDRALAFVAAALWAVHPLHTSVVVYVVHRYESVASLLMLGSLATFVQFARNGATPRARALAVTSVVSSALAMGAKEIAVGLPLLVLAYDRVFIGGSLRAALVARWRWHAALFATMATLVALRLRAPVAESQGFGFSDVTPLDYLRSQLAVVPYYLRLAVWPNPLSFDYFDWPVARTFASVAAPALLTFALLGASAWAWVRRPRVGYVGLVWFVMLAPTSSIVPLRGELVAERRVYLALIPVVALVVVAVARAVRERAAMRAPALLLAGAALVGLAARTVVRTRDFATAERAFESVLAVRPHNTRARYHLGLAQQRAGKMNDALASFTRAADDEPRCPACQNNAGVLLAQANRLPEAEARFAKAVAVQPADASYQINLAESQLAQKHFEDAQASLTRALALNPKNRALNAALVRAQRR